jgi:hypothetical protein
MYGIEPTPNPPYNPRMPFNRADYYVKRPAGIPGRCAPKTGILYKATINQGDGLHTELPILDCVADMQVRFCLNTGTATLPNYAIDDGTVVNNLTAAQLRQQLVDIQVFIVAQEGQRDASYDFANKGRTAGVGFRPRAYCGPNLLASSDFDMVDLSGLVNTPTVDEYRRYHWRLYTIVQRPTSMK